MVTMATVHERAVARPQREAATQRGRRRGGKGRSKESEGKLQDRGEEPPRKWEGDEEQAKGEGKGARVKGDLLRAHVVELCVGAALERALPRDLRPPPVGAVAKQTQPRKRNRATRTAEQTEKAISSCSYR